MIRLGVLTENDRVELIRGEIVPKVSIGPKHSKLCQAYQQSVRSTRVHSTLVRSTQCPFNRVHPNIHIAIRQRCNPIATARDVTIDYDGEAASAS